MCLHRGILMSYNKKLNLLTFALTMKQSWNQNIDRASNGVCLTHAPATC